MTRAVPSAANMRAGLFSLFLKLRMINVICSKKMCHEGLDLQSSRLDEAGPHIGRGRAKCLVLGGKKASLLISDESAPG
jgi:hypothetical protein